MKQADLPDRPTDEVLAMREWREEPVSTAPGAKTRIRMLDSSELDRLYRAGVLSQDQHHTLEQFQKDLYEAGMVFCPRAGLIQSGTSGHAQFIADTAFLRARRVSAQMELLATIMDLGARMTVIAALTDDRRVEKKKQDLMVVAADVLAEVYDPRPGKRVSHPCR